MLGREQPQWTLLDAELWAGQGRTEHHSRGLRGAAPARPHPPALRANPSTAPSAPSRGAEDRAPGAVGESSSSLLGPAEGRHATFPRWPAGESRSSEPSGPRETRPHRAARGGQLTRFSTQYYPLRNPHVPSSLTPSAESYRCPSTPS